MKIRNADLLQHCANNYLVHKNQPRLIYFLYKQVSRNSSCKANDHTTATSSPLKINTLLGHLVMETRLVNMNTTE